MTYKEDLIVLGIGVLLFVVGWVILEHAEPPLCVQNTYKAIEWAEKELGIRVACGGTCMYAVNRYLEAHNLTDKEFPTCCWASDEGPPMSWDEKVGFGLTSIGLLIILVGMISLGWDLLKLRRR